MDTQVSHKISKEPYREDLVQLITKIGYDYDIDIVKLSIPVENIHMVIKALPKMPPSWIMQIIKIISAREFFKLYPDIRQRYFGGVKLWTQSFFVEQWARSMNPSLRP